MLLMRTYRVSEGAYRNKLKFIFVSFIFAYLSGFLHFLAAYTNYEPIPHDLLIVFFVAILAYAILVHRLMDINVVIRKTLVYSLVSASLASVYVGTITLLAQILGGRHGTSPAVSSGLAAVLITLLFNPLRMRTQHWIDSRFPREHLDPDLLQEAAGNFAHEMKRPLTKISFPAQLALMEMERVKSGEKTWEEVYPSVEERLRYIINQSLEAGYVIEAIRELSSTALPFEPVDLRRVVDSALGANKDLLEKHGIEVRLHLPANLHNVSGRVKQLEIVFVNLIKNASEAMRDLPVDKKRELFVEGQTHQSQVVIRVRDTGAGIKPDDVEKIFGARFSTKGQSGTGLGLYLSHQIIQAHRGRIEVASRPNQGTEFTITLPTSS
jgi:signal transduction histidine kinase